MTTTQTAVAFAAETAIVEAARLRGEPDWLLERRAEAARAFAATPLPSRQLRPWKYTDVGALDFAAYRDEYQDGLREIIDAKVTGREIVAPEVEAPPKVVNLMEALSEISS